MIDPLSNEVRRDLGEKVLRRYAEIHHGKGGRVRVGRAEENNSCEILCGLERMSLSCAAEWNFVDDGWRVGGVPHTLQRGRHNCGVLCIQFAPSIVHGLGACHDIPDSLVVRADLDELRRRYVATTLSMSEEE